MHFRLQITWARLGVPGPLSALRKKPTYNRPSVAIFDGRGETGAVSLQSFGR
jgi:hypothetical protein